MTKNVPVGHTKRILCEEPFRKMCAELTTWRIDNFIRQLEATRGKGRVLPFVRGLRLSAHLIYVIRDRLEGTGLTANWGHLLDKKGEFCSCECDIIIHRDGHVQRWNGGGGGGEKQIMDFRFIEQDKAIVVVSCKSYLTSSQIDTKYCSDMNKFIGRIWLFAECCGPKSVKSIEKKALEHGYEKFWPLYTWSKQTEPELNCDGWIDFVEEVEKLRP